MRRAVFAVVVFIATAWAGVASAQQTYWVQVEANPTLREAQAAARRLAAKVDDVNGFRLGASGWYAIAIGPYSEADATRRLTALVDQNLVPRDAYVSAGETFAQQFWPVGAHTLNAAPLQVAPAASTEHGAQEPGAQAETAPATAEAQPMAEPTPPAPPVPEETRAEALASERQLDGEARKALQVALKFEGYYKSLIDGDFGPGTRGAMAAWQEDKGYDPTGILTTRQREEVLATYQGFLDSMGLAEVTDARAGISIELPTAMVHFTRYEAPFAHYEGDKGVRVVLISQRGDKATLFGLYNILQTLEVVPPDGPRERHDDNFTITGTNDKIISYTEAKLVDGAVKGFMLIWPQGPMQMDAETGEQTHAVDRRRAMVLDAMKKSFASTGATVLDDNAGLDTATQSIDLVSGLEIRRPDRSRSGFWVNDQGAVLTTTEAVTGCGKVTLNDSYEATVTATDPRLGAALLTPTKPLAPVAVAEFLNFDPRLQSDLAVAGYSYGGRLSSPTLTYGKLADVKGLDGGADFDRLEIKAQDGDTGGPVLDAGGAVVGMLMTPPSDGKMLPPDVGLVAKGSALGAFLTANGVTPTPTAVAGAMTPYDLGAFASNVTVLVSCWK